MKLLNENIVVMESHDTQYSIIKWLHENDTQHGYYGSSDEWLHTLKTGDIIVCNPPNNTLAIYKLNINILPRCDTPCHTKGCLMPCCKPIGHDSYCDRICECPPQEPNSSMYTMSTSSSIEGEENG